MPHKAGKLQQRLIEAAGIKLLNKNKQFLSTQAERGVISLGEQPPLRWTGARCAAWLQGQIMFTGTAGNVLGSRHC